MPEPAQVRIEVEAARGIVWITLSGFFRAEDYDAFAQQRAHKQGLLGGKAHATIADLRGLSIQSQDIVERFTARLGDPPYRARRLAFVVAQTLTRKQVARATATREVAFFECPAAAEAWVLAG
jgi:hypothetical protein